MQAAHALQGIDWYGALDETRRPLAGLEGERMFRHEAARSRRLGGALSVVSVVVDPALDDVICALVRECDFVSEGEPGELLIGLCGAGAAGAEIFVSRLRAELAPVELEIGAAQLTGHELIEDTVARARCLRE